VSAAPVNQATTSLCVLMCSFNRRETTLACLQQLQASTGLAGVNLRAQLVDDGSTDGTADAVRRAFSWVQVHAADGTLYWARAMHRAFGQALRDSHSHYLWLNDDTMLAPDALARLLATAQERRSAVGAPVIVVGSCVDEGSGQPSYGGQQRGSGWRRSRFTLVPPSQQPQRMATMDGNIVLISAEAAERVGNLDPAFEHAMADYDYGLRAAQAGVQVWLAPGVHGRCSGNPAAGSFHDTNLTLSQRWQALLSRKGLPWRSWRRFTRRHMGWSWPLYFVWPYLRVLLGRAAHAQRLKG
jgi:GT2 family glycosyltransferase